MLYSRERPLFYSLYTFECSVVMKNINVPQDNSVTYASNKKAIYATDEKGEYGIAASSGWEVEEEATCQALKELQRQADDAYLMVVRGEMSLLYFHMYDRRMDPHLLAKSTGILKWRIRRHFKPSVFATLSQKMLRRYAYAMGLTVASLCELPQRGK